MNRPDLIDIRSDGDLRTGGLTVGRITFDVPFPGDFSGEWFAEDTREDRAIQIDELEAEVGCLEDKIEDLRDEIEELQGHEKKLATLCDEVRACVASGEIKGVIFERLTDALVDAES